jgi:preprotein translocase subunit SecA
VDDILNYIDEESQVFVAKFMDSKTDTGDWIWMAIEQESYRIFGFLPSRSELEGLDNDGLIDYFYDKTVAAFKDKFKEADSDSSKIFLRWLMLSTLDMQWKDHLLSMDRLKDGIGLRGYAQKDPLREYQREGFDLFQEMVGRIRSDSLMAVTHSRQAKDGELPSAQASEPKERKLILSSGGEESPTSQPDRRATEKVGRNSLCPCGSGKKYKHCHGAG